MVDNASVRIQEAHKTRVVHASRAHEGHKGLRRNVHPKQAYENSRLVYGHEIRAERHLVNEVSLVWTDPCGTPALDGREVPRKMLHVRAVELTRVQRLLLNKARFPHP